MYLFNIHPQATAAIIAKATEKAIAQADNYEIVHVREDVSPTYGTGLVVTVRNIKTGAEYVTMSNGCDIEQALWQVATCNCPECQRSKFCKHLCYTEEEVQAWNQADEYSAIDGNIPEFKF